MTEEKKASTPLLDELETGPWPSFVKEMKKEAFRPMTGYALAQLERSYEEHISHWKHGGRVGVMGYGGGVIGRYSDLSEEFPAVAEFHTHRVNQPSAWFYTTDALRTLCDIGDQYADGHIHFTIRSLPEFLVDDDAKVEPLINALEDAGFIVGGTRNSVAMISHTQGWLHCDMP